MAREYAQSFYKGKQWKQCRKSYIAYRQSVDGGLCELCKDKLGYIVHHKEWITPQNINNPEITLNHGNLQYVCLDCHNRIEEGEKPTYFFTADGQIHPIGDRDE